ncbi:hypothetical protein [Nocardia sp. XZ_19_385]|uniref:hypothetical protein n=1 Tax=Nocardia sp. XZ_19_385 TaxID=2769488 RepID=UPI00188FFDB9|nr:hypothetical protein [Nocardia sp. XZ_19_385]
MRALRRIVIDIGYALPFVLAVAALLTFGLGLDGVWVTVVTVLLGMILGKIAEGVVIMVRAGRSSPEAPRQTEPIWQIWSRTRPRTSDQHPTP